MSEFYVCQDGVSNDAETACDNCGDHHRFADLDMICDAEMRLSPGQEVPAGQCPNEDCGALCYLVKAQAEAESPDPESYEGWSNRETWAVALAVDNAPSRAALKDKTLEISLEQVDRDPDVLGKKDVRERVLRRIFAASLQAWFQLSKTIVETNPTCDPSTAAMLLQIGSLYRVNWGELAEHWIAKHEDG